MFNTYFHTDKVLFVLPPIDNQDLLELVNQIKNIKPSSHVLIWQPFEDHDPRFFLEYINRDYTKNPEHTPSIKELERTLTLYNIKCYLLVGCEYSDAYINIKTNPIENFEVLFWPTAYFHFVYYGLTKFYGKNPLELYDSNRNIEKLYLNLNNADKYHRAKLLDYICKYNLFDYGVNTWNNDKSNFPFQHFKLQKLSFDEWPNKSSVHEKLYTENLIKVNNFIDVIGETFHINRNGVSFNFYSEKTPKVIFLGRPILILGNRNQNKGLEKYGFRLYDEIFDYTFDNEPNVNDRIIGIIDNLTTLKDLNYNELRDKVNDKIIFNMELAVNMVEGHDINIPTSLYWLIAHNKEDYKYVFREANDQYRSMFKLDSTFNLTDEVFKKIFY